ncbi:ficolin-1-A-like [Podarcis raffonei]|uniref:ficolin-1-A-like n=1 Tax=Podarcis raffonei TaxID=65483 RepID=UPI0023292B1D|nr:ficolin-1-A-like [Podarcis raffonei]
MSLQVFPRQSDGSVDFDQDWDSWKRAFGSQLMEFWLGNDHLHLLSSLAKDRQQEPKNRKWAEVYQGVWCYDDCHLYNAHPSFADGLNCESGQEYHDCSKHS